MTEPNEPGTGTPPSTDPTADTTDWKAETEKWKAMARQHEANSKKLLALEEAQKTEAQKLADAKAAAEKDAADSKAELLRTTVAYAKKLPPELAGRLRGSTKEELEKDADELLKLVSPQQQQQGGGNGTRPVADLRPATLPAGEQSRGATIDDWIRSQAGK